MKKEHPILAGAKIVSIREVQVSPSKALSGVTRVMRGSKTLGFFFPLKEIDQLLNGRVTMEDAIAAAMKNDTLDD